MRNTSLHVLSLALLPLLGAAHGATLAVGDGDDLNNDLFIDVVVTGAGDIRADGGNIDRVWVPEVASGTWSAGQVVNITGIALPVWANAVDSDNTNNTQNGNWTFSIYDLGADGVWQGTDNLGSSDDSLAGSATVSFNSANTGVNTFFVNFDSPISFTATNDSLVGVSLQSDAALRLKQGASPSAAFVLADGSSSSQGVSMSLAGTVVPEPSAALLGLGGLGLLLRRRRA